jgi:membrane protease YdiL (CAAX protease family)
MAWFYVSLTVASQSARGLTVALGIGEYAPLLSAVFLLFLMILGFMAISWMGPRQVDLRELLALPNRPGWQREWAVGAAVGWGIVIVAVLPMALAADLWPQFWITGRSLWLTLAASVTIAIGTFAQEFVFRGYPFRQLIKCVGPTWAAVILSVLFALAHPSSAGSQALGFLGSMLLGLLLSLAYLRTRALWLPWGLHFAWSASMGIFFGLPVQGRTAFSTLVEMRTGGPVWLTGGPYGPAGSLWMVLVLLAGMAVLIRVTRDYAWHYTHPPIVAAGYPMEPKVPAAHAAMEQEMAARTGDLVQIQPAASVPDPAGDAGRPEPTLPS